jgi:TetR/AcrR family transcriptional regulator, copper-responsive repressor
MRDRTEIDRAEKKTRGRPRAYDPSDALRKAASVFWRLGYAATSLDDIAAATGMNRPSLRAAFGDKHAIYVRALTDYWEAKFVSMRNALDDNVPLAEALMRAYDAALSVYFSPEGEARGCFVVGTAVTEAYEDPEVRRIVAEGFLQLDAAFEARLSSARHGGELRAAMDVKGLAVLASAVMHTIAVRARSGTPRDELRTLAASAVEVICR